MRQGVASNGEMKMNEQIAVGSKVLYCGYKGVVKEICSWDQDLIVVRLESGETCLEKSEVALQKEES